MLMDAWWWITDLGNSKILALVIFFVTFIGIVLYVYTNRKRSERLESYRFLPLQDDDIPTKHPEQHSSQGEK